MAKHLFRQQRGELKLDNSWRWILTSTLFSLTLACGSGGSGKKEPVEARSSGFIVSLTDPTTSDKDLSPQDLRAGQAVLLSVKDKRGVSVSPESVKVSPPDLAIVNPDGAMLFLIPGEGFIEVSYQGQAFRMNFKVLPGQSYPVSPEGPKLVPNKLTIRLEDKDKKVSVGDSVSLIAELEYSNGTTRRQYSANWQILDKSDGKASISRSGLLKAEAPGVVCLNAKVGTLDSEELCLTLEEKPAPVVLPPPPSKLVVSVPGARQDEEGRIVVDVRVGARLLVTSYQEGQSGTTGISGTDLDIKFSESKGFDLWYERDVTGLSFYAFNEGESEITLKYKDLEPQRLVIRGVYPNPVVEDLKLAVRPLQGGILSELFMPPGTTLPYVFVDLSVFPAYGAKGNYNGGAYEVEISLPQDAQTRYSSCKFQNFSLEKTFFQPFVPVVSTITNFNQPSVKFMLKRGDVVVSLGSNPVISHLAQVDCTLKEGGGIQSAYFPYNFFDMSSLICGVGSDGITIEKANGSIECRPDLIESLGDPQRRDGRLLLERDREDNSLLKLRIIPPTTSKSSTARVASFACEVTTIQNRVITDVQRFNEQSPDTTRLENTLLFSINLGQKILARNDKVKAYCYFSNEEKVFVMTRNFDGQPSN